MSQENNIVELTEAAANQVISVMQKENIKDKYLRVGVKGGGCSGLSYFLDFGDKQESDLEFFQHNVNIIIDEISASHLQGTVIDFSSDLMNSGFKFDNPNSQKSCGCGKSFSV